MQLSDAALANFSALPLEGRELPSGITSVKLNLKHNSNASCCSGNFCPLVPREVIQAKLLLLGCSNLVYSFFHLSLELALSYLSTHIIEFLFTFKLSKYLVGGYFL